MRFMFYSQGDTGEVARHQALCAQIDAFWAAFVETAETIVGSLARDSTVSDSWDLPQWMQDHLRCIEHGLMWEFGPALRCEGHRLVITPESRRELRPLTAEILSRAPDLPRWEFYAHRLPEDAEMAEQTMEARAGGTLGDCKVVVSRGESNQLDLTFHPDQGAAPDEESAQYRAFVAVETLLGELCLDTWIGAIEVAGEPEGIGFFSALRGKLKPPRNAVSLSGLHDVVEREIQMLRAELPAMPFSSFTDNCEWTSLELSPPEQEDYPGQRDLIAVATPSIPLWEATHCAAPFSSCRFSRCGETFAYVKIERGYESDGSEFETRGDIEEALDEALKAAEIGCALGGGTGQRYSHSEMALTDVAGGVNVVVQRMRQAKVPVRSWILFHDADSVGEWVGVYSETPEPPRDVEK